MIIAITRSHQPVSKSRSRSAGANRIELSPVSVRSELGDGRVQTANLRTSERGYHGYIVSLTTAKKIVKLPANVAFRLNLLFLYPLLPPSFLLLLLLLLLFFLYLPHRLHLIVFSAHFSFFSFFFFLFPHSAPSLHLRFRRLSHFP